MNPKRITKLNNQPSKKGTIIYWMTREQRVTFNWGLYFADYLALQEHTHLQVVFILKKEFLNAEAAHFRFMLEGLKETESNLFTYNIPFKILFGNPVDVLPGYLNSENASALITDFDPLKIKMSWKNEVLSKIDIPFYEVDSHNIVPCRYASPKLEYAAYTIRNKINSKLPEFLDDEYILKPQKHTPDKNVNDWEKIFSSLKPGNKKQTFVVKPGEVNAKKSLHNFLEEKLNRYPEEKNNPLLDAQSNLSAYLHFGMISSQYIAKNVLLSDNPENSKMVFNEELIVRKELSDNYCFYNQSYDTLIAVPAWAQATLNKHRTDNREFTYTLNQFENAETHEDLWNAAQHEMILTGKMHGYMRMYWAKKILEWSSSPEDALKIAIYLNDKYSLDGRDPNGYAGIAWSIAGVHDRPWFEREVYGQIRYMNREGCKRKFDIKSYIEKYSL